MKKFIVLMSQSGGCDYTIGCGMKWEIIEAVDIHDAKCQVFGYPDKISACPVDDLEDYFVMGDKCLIGSMDGDHSPSEVEIYELGATHANDKECDVFYEEIHDIAEERINQQANKKTEQQEIALLKQLSKKYKGKVSYET